MARAGEAQAGGQTRGLTADKGAARAGAAERLADLGRRVSAIALATGDHDLCRAVDYARSEWERMAEATFASQVADALDRSEARLADLADYGVTAAAIADTRDAVAQVATLGARRDNTAADREVATDAIYSDQALPALDQLDRLVPALVESDLFRLEYLEVRQIPGH